jgi:hypothetical protein
MKRKTPKLPPGTGLRPGEWSFPPDIFWITPDGVLIEVIGHLTAMQAHPDTFGFVAAPEGKREIDTAFQSLFESGWVRGRFSDGTFFFQMGRPRGSSLGGSHSLVVEYASHTNRVMVDFQPPYPPQDFTTKDFIEQRFPASWGINPSRRGRSK